MRRRTLSEAPLWRITVSPAAVKTLEKLGRTDRDRIESAIANLPSGDIKKLHGVPGEFRLRVGSWRVRFHRDIGRREISVLTVKSRGGEYKQRS